MRSQIKLATDTIERKDIDELKEWLSQEPIPQLTKGKLTIEYEEAYAKSVDSKYAVFVNSGSSANLLTISTLISDGALRNNKVVIPALSWITTISPVIQFGLEPILCDINLNDLAVDKDHLEDIFRKEKPSALFLVSVLGMSPDMDKISELCAKYGVILLLDNCEGQGSSYNGRALENYPAMSTCSSYFGHITSTVEGGMITTDNEDYYNKLKMLRSHGWDRDLSEEKRKELRKDNGITKFNQLYRFHTEGFNLRNTEIGAFFGLRQLKKLNLFIHARDANFRLYNSLIKNDYWKPTEKDNCRISNLGYPVISPKIDEIVEALRGNNVEVRPLISGNLGLHPFYSKRYGKKDLKNANIVDEYGLYLPNNQSITVEEIEFICEIVNKIIEK